MIARIALALILMSAFGSAEARINANDVTIKKYSARLDGFGSVMMATFTIRNDNTFAVKDIEVECDHYGGSGTKLKTSRKIIYQAIKGKQTRTLSGVNMGFIPDQAEKFECRLLSVEVA